MKTAALVALLFAVAGCASDDERVTVADQGFSMRLPDSWRVTRRGTDTVLVPDRGRRETISVRAGERGPGRDQTDPASLVRATEQVLRAYPRANLERTSAVRGDGLEGTAFQLSFVPPDTRRPYQRTHVLLVGEKRFWHVIHTAPAGESFDRAAFDAFVASIREEA